MKYSTFREVSAIALVNFVLLLPLSAWAANEQRSCLRDLDQALAKDVFDSVEFSDNVNFRTLTIAKPLAKLAQSPDTQEMRRRYRPSTVDSNLVVEKISLNKLLVKDEAARYLRVYSFQQTECWTIDGVDEWSLQKVYPTMKSHADKTPDKAGLQRGNTYVALANTGKYPIAPQLFNAALDSYLDAANAGLDEAAYKAAGLSLSGQAKRLGNEKIGALLAQGAKSNADAAIALAGFACDQGDYDSKAKCAYPAESIKAWETGAHLGSSYAAEQLAEQYENGLLVSRNTSKALACYKLAVKLGATIDAHAGIERLMLGKGSMAENEVCIGARS